MDLGLVFFCYSDSFNLLKKFKIRRHAIKSVSNITSIEQNNGSEVKRKHERVNY